MPPKGKKKNKKEPPSPQENRLVVRRREQEKKADAKKLAISLKRWKREQKMNKQMATSASYDTDNQESFQCESSFEEEKTDVDLPHSSFTEPSKSVIMEQKVTFKKPSIKNSKKIDQSHTLDKEPNVSRTTRQQINSPNENSRKNDMNPLKGKTLTNQKDLDINISKNVTESENLGRYINETEQISSRGISLNYSGDKKKTKDKQRCQKEKEDENKEITENEIVKISEAIDFTTNISKNFLPIENIKTMDITKLRKKIKQGLKALETVEKTVEEFAIPNSPAAKERKLALSGYIKISKTDKSVSNVDGNSSSYSRYFPKKKVILIGDKSINITIFVNDGSQVLCNLRKLPEINLAQDVKPCSDALEGHATDEDIKIYSKTVDQTNNETENVSKSVIEFPNLDCQKVEDQTVDNHGTDILRDSENREETFNDTKSNSSNIGSFSKEKYSSVNPSLREKVQQICDDFLTDFKSACEKFEVRIENQISDSLKSS